MSSTPEQFLEFAISAHKNAAGQEFNYRNAASRAYYAAFHCCHSERLRCPNLIEKDLYGSHDKLYARFQTLALSPESSILKSMAYLAKMMKDVRHKADYNLNGEFTIDDSEQQIKDAQSVFKKWQTIRTL